jgi:hypothetical protein
MKKILIVTALLAMPILAMAQTTNTSPTLNFFQTAMNWASAYNTDTNYAIANAALMYDTGIKTVTGAGIADRLNVVKPFGAFGVGVSGEFVGVGSTFNLLEGVTSYALLEKYDFKWVVQIGGGYDWNAKNAIGKTVGAMVVEPGMSLYKMMTHNTYSTVGISWQVESKGKFQQQPGIYVGLGATF